jgi:hypothetical protein
MHISDQVKLQWVVAGNHDLFAASRQPSWANGFTYPRNWFTLTSEERAAVSADMVGPTARKYPET